MRTTTLVASALAIAGLALPTQLSAGSAGATGKTLSQVACAEPYAPLAEGHSYSGDSTGYPVPEIPGEDIAVVPIGPQVALNVGALDMDGDAQPDELGGSLGNYDDSISVTRGDGVLGFDIPAPRDAYTAGDLDGDDRDELVVIQASTSPFGFAHTWIVPGTTAPGTYAPADVGIEVSAGEVFLLPDRDGDGHHELLVGWPGGLIEAGPSGVLSGADVMTVGAPGDARAVTPIFPVPGSMVGFVPLGAGPVTVIAIDDAGAHLVDESGSTDFAWGNEQFQPGDTVLSEVRTSSVGTFLKLEKDDRSGSVYLLWRIDEPCGTLPTEPQVTTTTVPPSPRVATGAQPIAGSPGYTG